MHSLIGDISQLNLQGTINPEEISVDTLLVDCKLLLFELLREKEVEITLLKTGTIFVDRTAATQLLMNLLKNSVEHSKRDRCVILIDLEVSENAKILSVKDNGKGIPEEVLPKIFQAGIRGRRQPGGMGLGLFICRRIVSLHGGTITIRNRKPTGVEAEIRLPPPTSNRFR